MKYGIYTIIEKNDLFYIYMLYGTEAEQFCGFASSKERAIEIVKSAK